MMASHPPDDTPCEEAVVYLNRFREACDYGLTRIEARMFAESDIDVGELRRLRRKGCPPALAAKIVL